MVAHFSSTREHLHLICHHGCIFICQSATTFPQTRSLFADLIPCCNHPVIYVDDVHRFETASQPCRHRCGFVRRLEANLQPCRHKCGFVRRLEANLQPRRHRCGFVRRLEANLQPCRHRCGFVRSFCNQAQAQPLKCSICSQRI